MGLDNFSYINMQDQHSPEFYHYSPPSVQGPASVPSVQELGPIKQEHSEQSDDSVSQMSSPPYSEPQSSIIFFKFNFKNTFLIIEGFQ